MTFDINSIYGAKISDVEGFGKFDIYHGNGKWGVIVVEVLGSYRGVNRFLLGLDNDGEIKCIADVPKDEWKAYSDERNDQEKEARRRELRKAIAAIVMKVSK